VTSATCASFPSLHDALPICLRSTSYSRWTVSNQSSYRVGTRSFQLLPPCPGRRGTETAYPCSARNWPHGFIDAGDPVNPCESSRSEEHTSELQSRENIVCRL